ncbi:MAG: YraN family protein [Pseudomonadota bacterium]
MAGQISYHAGFAAEDSVARHYEAKGHSVRARRWRGQGGEIDLIVEDGDGLIFVEVKKSRSIARAMERLTARQVARVCRAACEFVASEPAQMDTPMRFDFAVVGGHGEMEVVENITH